MPWGAAIAAVGAIGGGVLSSDSAHSAADKQMDAANNANQITRDEFRQTQTNLAPYMMAGQNGLNALQFGLGLSGDSKAAGYGNLTAGLSPDAYMKSPGYQWQLQQGQQAVSNAAAAHGGVNSGNTLKALTTFGQGLANTDYYQALQAQMAKQQQDYAMLQNLSGSGQNAAASLGGFGAQAASGIGSNLIGAGNAQAAGIIGGSNALGSGLSQALYGISNAYNQYGGGQTTPQGIDYGGNGAYPTAPAGGSVYSGDAVDQIYGQGAYSDRELKTDIEEVGKTDNGLKVYSYRMKGDAKTQIGLMADEVEKKTPNAVSRDRRTGYKRVNYLKALTKKAA